MPDTLLNPLPAAQPHIAARVHLSALAPQTLPGEDPPKREMFGVSLCAAPWMVAGQALPPLGSNGKLTPYLPWAWTWQAGANVAAPGFRWTLLVRMRDTAGQFAWKAVPVGSALKVFEVPVGVNDALQLTPNGADVGTIHETWWEHELARLTLAVTGGIPDWTPGTGGALPLAHSRQLDGFYDTGAPTVIDAKGGAQDAHADLLGQRMLRWSTENTPYNFVNRLAAIFATPSFPLLQAVMANEYAGFVIPDTDAFFAAAPLWVSAAYPALHPYDAAYDSPEYLVTEQTQAPASGVAGDGIPYLRRTYCNTVKRSASAVISDAHGKVFAGSSAGYALDLDDRPWRRDAETALGRCIDFPSLLLDWISVQLALQAVPAPVVDGFASGALAKWIVGLSADLFQARRTLTSAPADANAWLSQLAVLAAADKSLAESIAAVAPLLSGVAGLTGNSVETCAGIYRTLAEFIHRLRVPGTFARLRAGVESAPDTLAVIRAAGVDWVADAFQYALDQPLRGTTIRARVLPKLKGESRDVAEFCSAIGDYFADRFLATSAIKPQLAPADAAILAAFSGYLQSAPGAAGRFAKFIYGDPALPAAHLAGLSLTARLGDVAEHLGLGGDTTSQDHLDEHAGALVLGRLRRSTGAAGHWSGLTAGILRVEGKLDASHPDTRTRYLTKFVSDPPLRGGYSSSTQVERRSVSVDYDNRPLVAISRKAALVKVGESDLTTDESRGAELQVDYAWPKGRTLPPLRYFGSDVLYQFAWVFLSNSCCLPQGLWRSHPALLEPGAIDSLAAVPGVLVSSEVSYFRQAAITAPHVEVAFKSTRADGKTTYIPQIMAADRSDSDPANPFNLALKTWPALPGSVFPLSAETPPAVAPADTPLVLLFPLHSAGRPLARPHRLIHQVTLAISKPRTGDDNWERWVAANPGDQRAALRAVVAGAHRERDLNASKTNPDAPFFDPEDPENKEPHWQPDDPALAGTNTFLVVFRRLYPGTPAVPARSFILKWAHTSKTTFYGDAAGLFTDPFALRLVHDDALAPADFVVPSPAGPAGARTFRVAAGTVVEIGFYSLLLPAERARFAAELIDPPAGPNSLGQSVGSLLGGTIPADWDQVGGAAVGEVLAVSPSFLRVEAAKLIVPKSLDAYEALKVDTQGSTVTLSVSKDRDPEKFNLVHEVVAQEQIWRWNGKPSMPEDFIDPETGVPTIELPKPNPAPTRKNFAWDGIAFHGREDREHLAVSGLLPLLAARNTDAAVPGDLIFSDDKSADARALYFRFSALLRTRYYGAWPGGVVQAGESAPGGFATLWKRLVLPHRVTTPLKKPSIVMILPLLATGGDAPDGGDSAGVLAITRETCFEQAGLAEIVECEVVTAPEYTEGTPIHPSGREYFQAGYDPTLVAVALSPHDANASSTTVPPLPLPPVRISGPVGLTFDQGSRDPLIVNSLFFIDVDRKRLSPLGPLDLIQHDPPSALGSDLPSAAHLFCQLRFRRNVRSGYNVVAPSTAAPALASEWTEAQWVKFLPDSDRLRPADAAAAWKITRTIAIDGGPVGTLTNWQAPNLNLPENVSRAGRMSHYLFCITRHDLDAAGRPATVFHSIYAINRESGLLDQMAASVVAELPLTSADPTGRYRGRIVEALASDAGFSFPLSNPSPGKIPEWVNAFFPPAQPGITKNDDPITADAQLIPQSISAAWPIEVSAA